jgi:uncharacterized membrane protein YbaN (DUF454 family)
MESTMKKTGWARWGGLAGGWLLVAVGVVGCVVPVIPGIPLLLAGLGLLAYEYVWAKRLLERVQGWWHQVRWKKG